MKISRPLMGVIIALIFPILFFFLFDGKGAPKRPRLKRYIPLEAGTQQPNSILIKDTLWQTIPPFSFIGQNNKPITNETFKGKTYVADFFFTHCPSICPKLSSNLQKIQNAFKPEDEVMLLSHTVDPVRDTPQRLSEYADRYEADSTRWFFVTGDKKALYDQARYGYFVSASEGDGGEHDFVHTEKVVLVDPQGVIRGYYDGTDSLEINRLVRDIIILKLEFPNPRRVITTKPTP
jgi:protein SCO1/2